MQSDRVAETTLLSLVQSITDTGADEQTVVDTVVTLVCSGRVRLTGTFRNVPPSMLFPFVGA
jgi:hypothetical protein